MTCDIASKRPAAQIYRIGRAPDPWAWPDWSYAGRDGTFGNRYDDPEGQYRVLYASSHRVGAFVEVLARFRPDPAVVAACAEIDVEEGERDSIPAGQVPAEWTTNRMMGRGDLSGDFADVGDVRSLSALRQRLMGRLLHYGLDDLDAATIRLSTPRRFTQEVSRLIYECSTDVATPQFFGIFYLSRLGDRFENWAIFERLLKYTTHGTPVEDDSSTLISPTDTDLLEAVALLKLEFVG